MPRRIGRATAPSVRAVPRDVAGRTGEHLPQQSTSVAEEGELASASLLHAGGQDRDLSGTPDFHRGSDADLSTYRKLRRLEQTLELAHRAVRDFADERREIQWQDGFDTSYFIDWRSIVRTLLPDVVLVLRTDPRRSNFAEHPWRVIVPSLGEIFDVTQAGWLDGIQEPVALEQSDKVADALKVLFQATSSMDLEKKQNAQRVLSSAKRLLGSS